LLKNAALSPAPTPLALLTEKQKKETKEKRKITGEKQTLFAKLAYYALAVPRPRRSVKNDESARPIVMT